MNRTVLIGRLTRDPELKYTQNSKAVCTFSMAVPRKYGDQVDYIDIVVWGKQGENCANYLSKGTQAAVDGELQTRAYETKDGQKRKVYEVVADNVRFLSAKEDKGYDLPESLPPVGSEELPF